MLQEKDKKAWAKAQNFQEDGCFSAHCRKLLRVCGSACLNQYFKRCSVRTCDCGGRASSSETPESNVLSSAIIVANCGSEARLADLL